MGDVTANAVVETFAPQDEDASASGLNDSPEAASVLPPTVMSEPVSDVADEEESPSVDVTDKEHARVVTYDVEQDAANGTRPKRHRVRTAAREAVEENLLPRVEKLRQASNVVLDEAAYDPSLRFILIAMALFIIFLAILFASKVLG